MGLFLLTNIVPSIPEPPSLQFSCYFPLPAPALWLECLGVLSQAWFQCQAHFLPKLSPAHPKCVLSFCVCLAEWPGESVELAPLPLAHGHSESPFWSPVHAFATLTKQVPCRKVLCPWELESWGCSFDRLVWMKGQEPKENRAPFGSKVKIGCIWEDLDRIV